MDSMSKNDINEMLFLALNRCKMLSLDELIIYNYVLKKKISNITPQEQEQIQKLRTKLCDMLNDWVDTL